MPQSLPYVPVLFSRLGAWCYGDDAAQREHIKRLLRSISLYIVGNLLLWVGVLAGLTPAWSTAVVTIYILAGSAWFYATLRSGFSRRFRDASMAYPLLLFNASAVALSYILIEEARGAALQLLCLFLAFEMDRLSWQRLLTASLCTLGALASISYVRWILNPNLVHISVEIYNLFMAAVLLPIAIIVAAEVRRLYELQFQQREELKSTLTQLNHLSSRDDLTGLFNRRQILAFLDQEEKRQRRVDQPFCVAILDIDWFKRVNDKYGHAVGDTVLQVFSRLVSDALSGAGTLGRWGGEEFLLLMPASKESFVMDILAHVRQVVAGYDWGIHAPGLHVCFSAGVSQYVLNETVEHTLERADRALYRAKDSGRDRAVVATVLDEPDAACLRVAQPLGAKQRVVQPSFSTAGVSVSPVAGQDNTVVPHIARTYVRSESGAPHGLWQRLGDLVLSEHDDIRVYLRMPMLAMGLYGIWIAVFYWVAIPSGQMDATLGFWLVCYDMLAMLVFYPLIRSGWSARCRNRALALPQVLVACVSCVLGYVSAPILRPAVLHVMCVIQVFGMLNLYPKASRIVGVGAVLLLFVMLAIPAWIGPPDFNTKLEALKILLAVFIVGRLSMLSYDYSQMREKVASEQQQLAQAIGQVQELVIRDTLTGLFNRRHLRDLLEQERERNERIGSQFCVAIIDLDHFKRVNDTHGHLVGDEVLHGFAKAAQAALRDIDVIGRWGGEEFLVLMRHTGPVTHGFGVLERLRQGLAGMHLAPSAPTLTVTFSCGVALAGSSESVELVLERADRALYAAKAAGRDRCVMADC